MRFSDKVVLFISCILISSFVRADTTVSGGEAKAQHIKEIDSLKKSNPGKYESVSKMALIQCKMLLGRLGYDVGSFDLAVNDRVVSAIKAYEKNRGIPITGNHLAY
jgi:peptidoglycan hydrolase-like protein with peptidoglycan-binding domain